MKWSNLLTMEIKLPHVFTLVGWQLFASIIYVSLIFFTLEFNEVVEIADFDPAELIGSMIIGLIVGSIFLGIIGSLLEVGCPILRHLPRENAYSVISIIVVALVTTFSAIILASIIVIVDWNVIGIILATCLFVGAPAIAAYIASERIMIDNKKIVYFCTLVQFIGILIVIMKGLNSHWW